MISPAFIIYVVNKRLNQAMQVINFIYQVFGVKNTKTQESFSNTYKFPKGFCVFDIKQEVTEMSPFENMVAKSTKVSPPYHRRNLYTLK